VVEQNMVATRVSFGTTWAGSVVADLWDFFDPDGPVWLHMLASMSGREMESPAGWEPLWKLVGM
jgi:hypothetical protein